MRISIRHETRYAYDEPVSGAVMRLRLVPPATTGQSILNWQVSVNGEPVKRWIASGYGEVEALWRAGGRVSEVMIVAEGEVSTVDHAGVTLSLPRELRPAFFLRSTPLTAPLGGIAALAETVRSDLGPLDSLHRLCIAVHEAVVWKAGSTGSETTAAEALAQGTGVCQDQSHIFIAVARLLGVPARYVTGYMRDPERPDDEHDPHAWAEAWLNGLGWVAFDCTLGRCPTEGHVRLTVGLDAADAAPIRYIIGHGGVGRLSSDVQIVALPLDGAAQAQTQQ